MSEYLLITELKCPSEVQAKLAASMAKLGTCIVAPPDTVRIELRHGVDLSNKVDLDLVVRLVMQGVHDCNETEAQSGVFSD